VSPFEIIQVIYSVVRRSLNLRLEGVTEKGRDTVPVSQLYSAPRHLRGYFSTVCDLVLFLSVTSAYLRKETRTQGNIGNGTATTCSLSLACSPYL
jgi:hypothetical protein